MLINDMDDYTEDLEKTSRRLYPFYLLLLVVSPFPLGANRPWAWSIIAIFSFSLLAYYFFQYSRGKVRVPEISSQLKLISFCLILWLAYQVLLIIPLPVSLVEQLSPNLIATVYSGDNVSASHSYISLSIDRENSIKTLIKSSLYVSIFVLTLLLVQSKDRLRNLFVAIVLAGVAQAVIGMTVAFLDQSTLRGVVSSVSGTFVNRNHFAGFINLAIAASIGLILAVGIREKRSIHREAHQHFWQSRLLDWRVYTVFYSVIMIFALVFSQSRGGWVAFGAMLLCGALFLHLAKIKIRALLDRYFLPLLLLVVGVLIWGADVLVNRISDVDLHMARRLDIWKNSYDIFIDYWLTGVGTGNFRHIYPLYDSGFAHILDVSILHSHNDYLELLVEQGLIGFGLIAAVIILAYIKAALSIKKERSLNKSAFAIGSLMGMTGLLVHAFVDFNFQIPSNAMYFFVFLAIAAMQGAKPLRVEKRDIAWDDSVFNDPNEVGERPLPRHY